MAWRTCDRFSWAINNRLTELNAGLFDGVPALEQLFFGGNRLTEPRHDIFEPLANLRWLYFSANQLTALPDGLFDGLSRLRSHRHGKMSP